MHNFRLSSLLLSGIVIGSIVPWPSPAQAQDGPSPGAVFRVEVDMVLLNVAVTDNKGNYVTGLRPWDFQISEDGVAQKMATFGEGNETPRAIADFTQGQSAQQVQLAKPY